MLSDKFGYYQVGDYKTYSKLDAFDFFSKNKTPIKWNFNSAAFDTYNWTIDPAGDLEFWYKTRAEQIRNQYDYIVLLYSGGADSYNVLRSFVKNNIFVDEILQYHNLKAEQGNKNSWVNNEVFATSIPITESLISNNHVYKNTQHRVVDLTDFEIEIFNDSNHKWEYFYYVNTFMSPNVIAKSYFKENIPDYRKIINSGKKLCFLYGAEKPHVSKHYNGQWYVNFIDRIDFAVTPREQIFNTPGHYDELFYWSGDLPGLVAKQAHVIKKYMSQLCPSDSDDYHVIQGQILRNEYGIVVNQKDHQIFSTAVINGVEFNLTSHGLHRLIYPSWDSNTVVCGKASSLAYSERDRWFFKNTSDNLGQKYYNSGLLKLRNHVRQIDPSLWWEFKFDSRVNTYNGGFKNFRNSYCLGS
jgi:hypothetical protein